MDGAFSFELKHVGHVLLKVFTSPEDCVAGMDPGSPLPQDEGRVGNSS